MKHIIFAILAAFLLVTTSNAQVQPSPKDNYNWPVATATGPVGSYLNFDNPSLGGIPLSYTIDVYVTGTLPSTCTFEVQSSPNGTVWSTGTASDTGDVSCASATILKYSVYGKPDSNIKINIGTLTGADGTTQVHFFYKRTN